MILSGACDELIEHRSEMFGSIDILIDFINKYHKTENIHQSSLFSSSDLAISTPNLLQSEKWSKDECLKHEKDLLGFYLSDNPLLKYSDHLEELLNKKFLKIPFISVLTDPTMGGVSASLAMLGDIQIAEPNARIGFAGARVVEQTVREELPEGFQRSEFLLEKGAIDMIVHRSELRNKIFQLLSALHSSA